MEFAIQNIKIIDCFLIAFLEMGSCFSNPLATSIVGGGVGGYPLLPANGKPLRSQSTC